MLVRRRPEFLDYFAEGGLDLRLVVAFDFTSSNGLITDPKSPPSPRPLGLPPPLMIRAHR
jgi:hypothetical protein